LEYTWRQFANQLKRLREIEKYADFIVSHPPMAVMQQRPYAQYLSIGVPLTKFPEASQRSVPVTYRKGETVTRIAHAPSHPQSKGSVQIEAIVERLRNEGHRIDFTKATNLKNTEVIQLLTNSDLLVDQLYSDTPMAHLSAEAAMVGCPSLVCGNDLLGLRQEVEPETWPPTIIGRPEDLYDNVLWAIENPVERLQIGESAQTFVRTRWRAKDVAERFLRLADSSAPQSWFCDPAQSRFWGGYGMTLDSRDALIERLVSAYGDKWMAPLPPIDLPLPR